MSTLIALYSSRPQSGKSTIARHMVRQHGFSRVSFARTIRAMVRVLVRCFVPADQVEDWIDGPCKEDPVPGLGTSVRRLLQTLGTEWGREMISPDIWVAAAWREVAVPDRVVIDDMRFKNEFEMVKKMGGLCVQVERKDRSATVSPNHASDGALEGFPFDWRFDLDEGPDVLHVAADTLAIGSALPEDLRW